MRSAALLFDARGAAFVLALLGALGAAGCSDDDGPSDPPAPSREEELAALLEQVVASPQIPGGLLEVVTSDGFDWSGASGEARTGPGLSEPMRPGLRFRAGSITKMLTAVVTLQLADEGVLALEDSLPRWLRPSLADSIPDARRITVRQLLNHTSGLADYVDQPSFQVAVAASFLRRWSAGELVAYAIAAGAVAPPGEQWSYASTNYVLLGMITEAASGRRFADLIEERIVVPLSMTETEIPRDASLGTTFVHGYDLVSGALRDVSEIDPSYVGAAGALVTTTHDLAVLAGALFEGDLLSPHALLDMEHAVETGDARFGYGLGLTILPGPLYGHAGLVPGYTTGLFYSPAHRACVILCLNVGGAELSGVVLLQAALQILEEGSTLAFAL